jgi:multiple sugar transport system permease protein
MVGDKGWKKAAVISFFLLPNLIGFLFFIGVPILASFGLSFTDWDLLSAPKFVGLDNYIRIFDDPGFWVALSHTLTFIAGYLPTVIIPSLFVMGCGGSSEINFLNF